ncbi:acyl carrier protein [Pectobacterium parvum]|uniref:acyl carrier protein n=1 Tax=Pectobacterium TaxID=122277 RepID=UPI0005053030|nr:MULTISPECIES: acyl carrier protein [Pectobacterium]GKW44197.1 hypothetical protein PEC301879_40550 [Pectobacterium carotovorum subsp. carotovorum]KFX10097.1 hypothetical protein KP17_20330 [Pectobacterium parvum]MCU1803708.1 acyl carrier protein [Pectobacterium parvum]UFK38003.1 acyl carrier protein [Pectobacterium parvum]UVD98934.1 acyl carrier protein [Pectobacterium parvum]
MEFKSNSHKIIINEIKSMLNETDVRLDDNFTELGGNSIMAIIIANNLQKNYSIKIELAQLLGGQIGEIELIPLDK